MKIRQVITTFLAEVKSPSFLNSQWTNYPLSELTCDKILRSLNLEIITRQLYLMCLGLRKVRDLKQSPSLIFLSKKSYRKRKKKKCDRIQQVLSFLKKWMNILFRKKRQLKHLKKQNLYKCLHQSSMMIALRKRKKKDVTMCLTSKFRSKNRYQNECLTLEKTHVTESARIYSYHYRRKILGNSRALELTCKGKSYLLTLFCPLESSIK